jgi:hypothetical protein
MSAQDHVAVQAFHALFNLNEKIPGGRGARLDTGLKTVLPMMLPVAGKRYTIVFKPMNSRHHTNSLHNYIPVR